MCLLGIFLDFDACLSVSLLVVQFFIGSNVVTSRMSFPCILLLVACHLMLGTFMELCMSPICVSPPMILLWRMPLVCTPDLCLPTELTESDYEYLYY